MSRDGIYLKILTLGPRKYKVYTPSFPYRTLNLSKEPYNTKVFVAEA